MRPRLCESVVTPAEPGAGVAKFVQRLHGMGIYDDVVRLIKPRGVLVEDLVSRNRHKNIAGARHEIMYWIRKRLNWSFPEIGRLFERDHTSVIAACRKVHQENPSFGDDNPYDASDWIIR